MLARLLLLLLRPTPTPVLTAARTRARTRTRAMTTPAEPKTAHDEFLAAQLASLPPLASERLSPAVIRIMGHNPGKFTLQGTNTYLVGTGATRLLIDTAGGHPLWHRTLASVLAAENATVGACLITHHHGDHTGGLADLLASSPATEVHKHAATPLDIPTPAAAAVLPIAHGQTFAVPGATLTALHTPGHTPDHVCFRLREEAALFTGDTVLGHGTTVFGDLAAYMGSLRALAAAAAGQGEGERGGRLYPAHGAVVEDGARRLAQYVRHREQREAQVLGVLRRRQERGKLAGLWGGSEGVTGAEIVGEVYAGLGAELALAAERGVVMVLEKVAGEGGVRCREEGGVVRWFVVERTGL